MLLIYGCTDQHAHSHSIMRNVAHIGISRGFAVLSGRFWGSYSLILFILIINYLCKSRHFILNKKKSASKTTSFNRRLPLLYYNKVCNLVSLSVNCNSPHQQSHWRKFLRTNWGDAEATPFTCHAPNSTLTEGNSPKRWYTCSMMVGKSRAN